MDKKKLDPNSGEQQMKNNTLAIGNKKKDIQQIANQLNLKFCKDSQIFKNRILIQTIKNQFCQRQSHLKQQGQKLEIFGKVISWVEDNAEQLWKIYKDDFNKNRRYKINDLSVYKNRADFEKYVLELAENYLLKRRKKLRKITVERLKEITAMTNEFKFVEDNINEQIEAEYKYF